MAAIPEGIQLSKINPNFLHSNSTSHVWAFGALAGLIDNAYDPDVGASSLIIDMQKIGTIPCLIFVDNGTGMDKEKLIRMLSFGYCDKSIYNSRESYKPVGLYGNGFKSGSMRLGKDALVFSRCDNSACIGFLSQTYLEAIGADSVILPILEYSLPDLKRNNSRQCLNNLEAILQYSVFKSEASLKEELNSLKSSVTGTKIFIFNLHILQSGKGELDFQSDRKDIRCPDPYMADTTNFDSRPVNDTPEYKRSLREYCSILYLRPRMKIILRGHPVKSKYISKMLYQTEDHQCKPSWMGENDKSINLKIGFSCEDNWKENYGLMLYHKNRLMRAYERVGYQKQANERGVGVIGVVELNFITPTHNKQDFDRNDHFNSIMAALARKLDAYWKSKNETQNDDVGELPVWVWIQCDNCLMWRRMPPGTDGDYLPKHWFCHMNKDAQYNRCFEDEEPEAPAEPPRLRNRMDNWQELVPIPNQNMLSPSEHHSSTPSQVETMENTRKRKNVINDPLQVPSTSSSGYNVEQKPKPNLANPTAEKVPRIQEDARNILMSIIKNKQLIHLQKSSTSQQPAAQNSSANNVQPRTFSDASLQTDIVIVTPFHHYVHELLVIMTDTDPGKLEDVETVVTNIVEEYRQSDN